MLKRIAALVAIPLVAMSGALAAAPATLADKNSEQIALNNKVRGSLVFLEITYSGRVQVPADQTQEGVEFWSDPVSVTAHCSSFVVDPAGFIATAGHCVDPKGNGVLEGLRSKFVLEAVKAGSLSDDIAPNFLATANQQQWLVEGANRGTPPDRQVLVVQPESAKRVIDRPITAQVVDFQPFTDGDNALLKAPAVRPLQPLVVANKAPEPGQDLTSVGWPGSVANVVDANRLPEPSFKSGTASSVQVKPSGAQSVEINADVSRGMSGGPTMDNETGEVLCVNSYGIVGENQAFNFITNAPELRSFLQKNGVHLAESVMPEPKSFPWWIVVGLAVVAVAAGVLVWLIRKRKIGHTQAAAAGPAPSNPALPPGS